MTTNDTTLLTRDEVLFSWALAEAMSPRWHEIMCAGLPTALLDKLEHGNPVFTDSEKQALITRLSEHRKDKIKGYITPFSAFHLRTIPVANLEQLAVSPQVSGWDKTVTLAQFIAGNYSEETAHDPRNMAKRWLLSNAPLTYNGYPIVSYSKRLDCPVLIEGYTRCIAALLHHRKGNPVAPLEIIFCVA